jgi:hypothetical protein
MTVAVVKNSAGEMFIVHNTVRNSAGSVFMVDNYAYNAAGDPFLIFTDTVDVTPQEIFQTTVHRGFVATEHRKFYT